MSIQKQNNKHCEANDFKRVRFFHGMLLGDTDFTAEQVYHMEKRKLLNRSLHGWGVVCGLGVKLNEEQTKITIEPGIALDCHGNEIAVCEPVDVPIQDIPCLCPEPTTKTPKTAKECREMLENGQDLKTCYIGIRFDEVKDDPVPVHTPAGGCEEKACDYSRIREGFCIDFFDELPKQPVVKFEQVRPFTDGENIEIKSLANLMNEAKSGTILEGVRDGFLKDGDIDFEDILSDGTFTRILCNVAPGCPICCPSEHYVILGTVQYESVSDANTETWEFNVYPNERRQYILSASYLKSFLRIFLEGAKDFVCNYPPGKVVELPDTELHENPFAAICWIAKLYTQLNKQQGESFSIKEEIDNKLQSLDDKYQNEIKQLKEKITELKKEKKPKESPKKSEAKK